MKYAQSFIVKPGTKVNLKNVDPGFTGDSDKNAAKDSTQTYSQRLSELQYKLYAEGKWSLLICLQGMDASGKDGTIKHVLGAMNPQGTRVCGFKVPTVEEAAHDFLWRIEKQAPARGEIVVFNRSHYEDVLIVRVHNLVPEKVWSKRYASINCFEKQLAANGTHILKFYLHISKDEQLKRYGQRLDDPARQWKISEADYQERDFWDDYMQAYEVALSKTSTSYAPWYIIPANHKWFRNLAISRIVVEKLESLGMKIPKPTVNIEEIRSKYHLDQAEEHKE